jgi:hypothetical protein
VAPPVRTARVGGVGAERAQARISHRIGKDNPVAAKPSESRKIELSTSPEPT